MMPVEIAKHIEALGYGTFDVEGTNGNIFVMSMPEKPHKCICIYQYQGDGRLNKNIDMIEHPGLQIVSRADSAIEAFSLLEKIVNSLDQTNFTSDGVYYPNVTAKQEPFLLKRDENGRYVYAVNFEVSRRKQGYRN